MAWRAMDLVYVTALLVAATPAMAHCEVEGNAYIDGDYQGECDEQTELAQGQGEATGADRYVGYFAQGKPDGKGTYTWANGARLDGNFKDGKAHGTGVYVSAKGVRYEGRFVDGKLGTLKSEDCPATPGPLAVAMSLRSVRPRAMRFDCGTCRFWLMCCRSITRYSVLHVAATCRILVAGSCRLPGSVSLQDGCPVQVLRNGYAPSVGTFESASQCVAVFTHPKFRAARTPLCLFLVGPSCDITLLPVFAGRGY